ncbi:hypothetical protein [Novosphingobium sp.]|uniref:hypothetical protein n=1 Tax=Novosphingobium sp. TaxID=1874826 RepID=UPI002602D6B0|nr:hypothetical protein [Novosphingobium sp.]
MKEFFRNVSPVRAAKDLWQILGAPSEFRLRSLALAVLVTLGIFSVMWQQGGRGLPRPPEVIYFESWRADRSDAEIMAGNIEATKKARAEAAAEQARADDVRKMYKAVGAATGLDTEAMDRQARAEREAQIRTEQARNKALLDRLVVKPTASAAPSAAKAP